MAFTVTRVFNAPREAVYDAWINADSFAAWFGGAEVAVEKVVYEPSVRSQWSCTMVLPDGSTIDWVGEFLELDPPSRIVMTMNDEPTIDQGEAVTVTLVEVADGTEMTMHQVATGFSEEQVQHTIAGWNSFFDTMATLVA